MHNPQGLFSGTYVFIFSEFILRECRFSINSKVSFMNSGDKPSLTWKISVTNFCGFRHFADFVFKIVLLGQNRFQPFAFCWVEYCVIYIEYWFIFEYYIYIDLYLIYIETLKLLSSSLDYFSFVSLNSL